MQGLQQYIAFAATARAGGFAAAAREQGVAPSTLAKAVARLEVQLGVKLFHRTTRQVTLTPDGQRLFHRCERVLAEVDDLQAEASSTRSAPAGLLRVDMPVFYGRQFVLPLLAGLAQQHPGLRLDLRLTDSFADLVREGIDLAVRIGTLEDSSLVARRVDQQHLVLCASPAYLAARGTPRSIDALAGHAAIVFRLPSSGRDRPWQLRRGDQPVVLAPAPAVRIGETEALVTALRLGLGICQLPDMLVEADLARGTLVELLPGFRPPPMPIQLVYPSGRQLPARVRAAIETLDALRHRGQAADGAMTQAGGSNSAV